MNIERDVIIVGAGIAGSICASYLSKAGADVLMLDREVFPRDKACGDVLRERVVRHLSRLGVVDDIDKIATLIRKIHLLSDNDGECVLPMEAYVAPRFEVDNILADVAVKRGTEFRDGCRVRELIIEDGYVRGVRVREKGVDFTIRARLVILADGAGALIPQSNTLSLESSTFVSGGHYVGERAYFAGVNLEEVLTKGRYNAYGVYGLSRKLTNGYYWIVPSGAKGVLDGYCNVGIIRDVNASADVNAAELIEELIGSNKRVASLLSGAKRVSPWKRAELKDITGVNIGGRSGNGYLVIGNAGSIMMPLLKDGIGAAADSGELAALVAKEAISANDFSAEFLHRAYDMKVEPDEDRLKYERMTVESMYDTSIVEHMIARMVNNPTHTNRVLNEVFR